MNGVDTEETESGPKWVTAAQSCEEARTVIKEKPCRTKGKNWGIGARNTTKQADL